ncbi:choline transporter-like protein, partial [Ochromonadaceae sp. CCMP2298]
LLPVVQAAGLVIFLCPWFIYNLYLASSGDIEIHTAEYEYEGVTSSYSYRTFEYKPNTRYAFLFMLFSFFWPSEFILAVGQLVVALSFTAWYFTRDKRSITSATVWWVLRTACVHHLGTAAFGSLIVAIIRTIRFVILYFQKKMKRIHNK